MLKFFCIFLCFFIWTHIFALECNTSLLEIQRQIEITIVKDREAARPLAWVSSYYNSQESRVAAELTEKPGGKVLSLGSGADVLRPLYNFPLADEYHLVDSLAGWGKMPWDVINEINSRLEALASNYSGELDLIDFGFADLASVPELSETEAFYERADQNIDFYKMPFVWELRLKDSAGKVMIKRIFLHFNDYNIPVTFQYPLAKLSGDIVGVIVTGAPLPEKESLGLIIENVTPEGLFIYENYRIEHKAESPEAKARPDVFQRLIAMRERDQKLLDHLKSLLLERADIQLLDRIPERPDYPTPDVNVLVFQKAQEILF